MIMNDEFLEKEDNYVGSQIGKYLSPEEMSKFKVGETVRKMFDKLWHDGRIESIDTKNKFYRVVYEDNDKEDMTMQEVRKFWVKPETEDKSSSKKKQRTKKNYTTTGTEIGKIQKLTFDKKIIDVLLNNQI